MVATGGRRSKSRELDKAATAPACIIGATSATSLRVQAAAGRRCFSPCVPPPPPPASLRCSHTNIIACAQHRNAFFEFYIQKFRLELGSIAASSPARPPPTRAAFNAPAHRRQHQRPCSMLTKAQNNVISYSGAAAFFLAVHAYFGSSLTSADPITADSRPAAAACILWVLHFARRAVESAFLEKHTAHKIPLGDSLGEFAYYWIFAAWIAYSLATAQQLLPSPIHYSVACCGWVMAEAANFSAHVALARTPSRGGKRVVPASRLFSRVCCPHYLAETLSWAFFSLCCPVTGSVVFALAGACIMMFYALERWSRYAACDVAFAASGRKAMLPYIL